MTREKIEEARALLDKHRQFEDAGTCDRYCAIGLRTQADILLTEVDRLRAALEKIHNHSSDCCRCDAAFEFCDNILYT